MYALSGLYEPFYDRKFGRSEEALQLRQACVGNGDFGEMLLVHAMTQAYYPEIAARDPGRR
jgi:hypothetical protein